MRNNLITRFYCSECGERLILLDEDEQKVENKIYSYGRFDKEEPVNDIGACNRVIKIQVEPCRQCIDKYTAPAKKLLDGINELTKAGDK